MELLSRAGQRLNADVFNANGEVQISILYFKNVAMCGKEDSEKHLELLDHLYSEAFPFYFERFTIEGDRREGVKDFYDVKAAFSDRFEVKEGPQNIIRKNRIWVGLQRSLDLPEEKQGLII